ncbi:GNAT family N-acetyltransferase [Streptomyces resistomycificus]|uniref:Acetyltransferase n=1 Tax=Streptomyces resistomycificus TaxID=67356 RepID=A0A0L8L7C9_9ACTN|nr:GNAT family N-acetyltransferase [Streptomyces resistomycificus]KOG33986.1 acetyltransferase [Streptomyces resistomycificus]KUN96490.1 acetyltransferase [Streptomyces resistomycificus]
MRDLGGERVAEAVAGALALLRKRTATDRDWEEVRAGGLEWSCRDTAEHLAGALLAYAGQLAGRAQHAWVPFEITLDEGTGQDGLLDVVETAGALLVAAFRATPRRARAFHPYPFGSANREGFAAMGVAEVLLHTRDVAEGLGLAYTPAEELAEYVLTRLFPHVRPGPDHWRTLLWATGRGELPGRAPVTEWKWRNNLVLTADRLTLEGVTPAAAADLCAGGDGGFDWLAGGPYEGTLEAAGMMLKAYEAGVHRPEFGLFALVRHSDGRAVGGMGFHGVPDEEGRAEVGYDLVEGARGNGYATEALRVLCAWALARDDVRSLFATVEPGNAPSQAVIARAGFVRVSEELDEDGLRAYELRG